MIRKALENFLSRRYLAYLENADPNKLLRKSEKSALVAFQNAARRVPAYRKRLEEMGIKAEAITSSEEFRKNLPILDKEKTFIAHKEDIRNLCVDGSLGPTGAILSSSGHSGNFSYGLLTRRDLKNGPRFVDFSLDHHFGIAGKKTLLINCLPMGVKVPSENTVVADVSVRKDMAVSLVRSFGGDFNIIILVGENSFIKEVLEFGREEGIDWRRYDVRIVIGEEGFPESYRSYMAKLLDKPIDDTEEVRIGSSMGISELGLTVFQEDVDTIRIRRQAEEDEALRHELFGDRTPASPMLFRYYPMLIHLEEHRSDANSDGPAADLLFTNLDTKARIPLVRYSSGDRGRIIPYDRMKEVLRRHDLAHLTPKNKLPLVAVYGRNKTIDIEGESISPEEVKAGLYSDMALPPTTTGNFKISQKGNALSVEVQLKKGIEPTRPLSERYHRAIKSFAAVDTVISLSTFEDFPYLLDYEKKLRYID